MGPAEVIERRGLVNYGVKFESGEEKTFHINMLKEYHEGDETSDSAVRKAVAQESISAVNDEQDDEEWMRVVEISDNEEDDRILEGTDTETVAAMGVVVDSDSEEEECHQKEENSDAVYYSTEQKETRKDVNINPCLLYTSDAADE